MSDQTPAAKKSRHVGGKKELAHPDIGRHLYDHSPDGILLLREGFILDANPAACELLGYLREEMLGARLETFVDRTSPIASMIGESGFPPRETREPLTLIRKDASVLPTETTIFLSPRRKGDLMALVLRDITEHQKTVEALRESENLFHSVVDSMLDSTLILERDGTILFVNEAAARLVKVPSTGTALGMNITRFLHPDSVDQALKDLNQIHDGKEEFIAEYRLCATASEDQWVEALGAKILFRGRDADLITARDITERRKLEGILLHAQKMEAVGTLAGGVAHEINNLLMGIQGYTSLALSGMNAKDPNYDRLRSIEEQVRNGANLTEQLLAFAQGGRYEVRPTDLNTLLEKTAEMFGRTKKKLRIYKNFAQDLWNIEADQRQIEQVLLNLYINAWQAMPGGGKLFLETRNAIIEETGPQTNYVGPGRYVRVSVSDTGEGMNEKTMARIFEPFFTTKEMGRGAGLGLAAAYGVIKGHGGFINASSEKDHGTTFTIYMPASEQKLGKGSKGQPLTLQGHETILIVDDETFIIDVTRDILQTLGYEVLTALNGQEAVQIYRSQADRINLVILDMIMPEMGGGETFDLLKKIKPGVRVVLASGYSVAGQAQTIMNRGCRGFLQKPFTIEELSKKVREVLDQKT